jgi:predicted amidohydrolase
MKSEIKIAIIQMTSTENVEKNFDTLVKLIESVKEPLDWIFTPENSLYLRIDESDLEKSFDLSETYFLELQKLSQKKQVPILLGSVPVRKKNGVFNSSVVVNAVNSVAVYDKIHLFDVDVKGEKSLRESDRFKAGEGTMVLSKDGWRLGLSICYDLRFSELYSQYASDEVDMIHVPSAFLQTTGQAHWHVLLRARAIENQCYVVAPAQVGPHVGPSGKIRSTYGHSLVVSPWGEVLVDLSEQSPKIEVLNLKKSEIEKVRRQIPMKSHRRLVFDRPSKNDP